MHAYLNDIKQPDNEEFREAFKGYSAKYRI